jgi:nucleotide-binding universal stress UspA family protein
MDAIIVVGYEGSDRSQDALALAEALAASADARLLVVCVHPPKPRTAALGSAGFDREVRAGAQRTAESAATLLARPEEADFDAVLGMSAAHGLAAVATERHAAVIVLGSSDRSVLGRVMSGGVASRLTPFAPCDVVVAPTGYAERARRSLALIGVAYDGSEPSSRALHLAERLAARRNGRLRIITVAESNKDRDAWSAQLEQAAIAAPVSVRAQAVLRDGEPAEQLAQVSTDLDLLVCGSRGHGPVRRLVLGSVSTALMASARCPILVVRAQPDVRRV